VPVWQNGGKFIRWAQNDRGGDGFRIEYGMTCKRETEIATSSFLEKDSSQ
jgi:hypothetical protein